jgi:hypothetical protein
LEFLLDHRLHFILTLNLGSNPNVGCFSLIRHTFAGNISVTINNRAVNFS